MLSQQRMSCYRKDLQLLYRCLGNGVYFKNALSLSLLLEFVAGANKHEPHVN